MPQKQYLITQSQVDELSNLVAELTILPSKLTEARDATQLGLAAQTLLISVEQQPDKAPDIFDKLITFQQHAKSKDFCTIFGDAIGTHLWHKFLLYQQNILTLYRYLDTQNAQKLATGLVH